MIRRRSETGEIPGGASAAQVGESYLKFAACPHIQSQFEGESMTATIVFASHVASNQRGSLESLVYFNSCQSRVADSIVEAVERFGPLEIVQSGERLRVRVSGLHEAQSLFAIEASSGRPIGVAVYVRPDFQHITVVHLGVAAEFASGGMRAREQLLLRLLREVRRSSRRIKGVEHFELYYAARERSTLHQQYAAYA
jgi:predicted GNAT family acetyltransferase